MQEPLEAWAMAPADALLSRSPVRCGLCHRPVVRSLTAPPVLLHQVVAQHGSGRAAVDFFLGDGPCPLEQAPIPDEAIELIPPAARPYSNPA